MNTSKRTIISAFAAAAITATLVGTVALAGPTRARGAGELRDLQLAVSELNLNVQPFDHATAQVVAVENGNSTTVTLKVQGIDHSAAGNTYGAHVHTGPCQVGAGSAAGPHYKHDAATPSRLNEVWLDFTVLANGTGAHTETVPFVIGEGAALSVVIHQLTTSPGGPGQRPAGNAGDRWACVPVEF